MNFTFVPYKDTNISILSSPDDIQVLLEDHIVKTTTMKGSPFIGPFEDEVNQWDITLVRLTLFHFIPMQSSEWDGCCEQIRFLLKDPVLAH